MVQMLSTCALPYCLSGSRLKPSSSAVIRIRHTLARLQQQIAMGMYMEGPAVSYQVVFGNVQAVAAITRTIPRTFLASVIDDEEPPSDEVDHELDKLVAKASECKIRVLTSLLTNQLRAFAQLWLNCCLLSKPKYREHQYGLTSCIARRSENAVSGSHRCLPPQGDHQVESCVRLSCLYCLRPTSMHRLHTADVSAWQCVRSPADHRPHQTWKHRPSGRSTSSRFRHLYRFLCRDLHHRPLRSRCRRSKRWPWRRCHDAATASLRNPGDD